jgi:hypothetical protein
MSALEKTSDCASQWQPSDRFCLFLTALYKNRFAARYYSRPVGDEADKTKRRDE